MSLQGACYANIWVLVNNHIIYNFEQQLRRCFRVYVQQRRTTTQYLPAQNIPKLQRDGWWDVPIHEYCSRVPAKYIPGIRIIPLTPFRGAYSE